LPSSAKRTDPVTARTIRIEDAVKLLTFSVGLMGFFSAAKQVGAPWTLIFAILYLLSLYAEYRRRFLIPGGLLTGIALCCIIVTFLRVTTDDFVSVVMEALLILLAIKLLGEKRFRDYMQVYVISLFLLIGSALLSEDIEFLFTFMGMLFVITITVVLLTYFSQDASLVFNASVLFKIVSRSSLISLIALPATFFMFLLLPRTGYPVFHLVNEGTAGLTGFSDAVRLGTVSDIQEDTTVIFRVQSERINEAALYWRGIVLDYFDGSSWESSRTEKAAEGRPLRISGKRVRQTVYLEPYGNRYLFALDKPSSLLLRSARKGPALTYNLPENIFRRIRYETLSTLSDRLYEKDIDKETYLQLPGRDLTKMRELAQKLSAGRTAEDTAYAFLRFLRDGDYRYSFKKLPLSDNPLDDFLFRSRYGNCEYFASALAVMLRITGIPSRLVGGYRGGDYNEVGQYYIVARKNAHVWVEAYLDNKGWLRVDPTPAGIETPATRMKGLFFKTSLFLDSISYYWNAIIINYDFTKQLTLFNKLRSGVKRPRLNISVKNGPALRYSLIPLFGSVIIVMVYVTVLRRRPADERVLRDFLKRMERNGYRKGKTEGLEEFAAKVNEEDLREKAFSFVREFERYFYRDKKISKNGLRNLKKLSKIPWTLQTRRTADRRVQ
jgi:transglutaminase-like putative cysteine protease